MSSAGFETTTAASSSWPAAPARRSRASSSPRSTSAPAAACCSWCRRITLLSQTLSEWVANAACRSARSRCAPTSRSASARQTTKTSPSSTSPSQPRPTLPSWSTKLADGLAGHRRMTVVFATYQSIDVVAQARGKGIAEFDLIVCDEAHRTTGVTLAGEDESAFVRVHDHELHPGGKRALHDRHAADLRRLVQDEGRRGGRGPRVDGRRRVLWPGVPPARLRRGRRARACSPTTRCWSSPSTRSPCPRRFQRQLADENNELTLDDAAKIVGCWNGLAKRC